MASSPPYPYPLHLPNPRKRQSFGGQSATSQPASKRPRMHQLSITSFPAPNEITDTGSALYTPIGRSAKSETGSMAHSAISASSSKVPGRGRGRPRKSAQINDEDVQATQRSAIDNESQVNGTRNNRGGTKSVISARSGQDAEEEDDEEELDNIQPLTAAEEDARDHERLMRLKDVLDSAQQERYEFWKASRLDPKTMRTLVNQACSQSVTKVPLAAVNIYAKFFVGELLERAREVQVEFAEAYEATREAEKVDRQKKLEQVKKQLDEAGDNDAQRVSKLRKQLERVKKEAEEYIPNPHRGGLMPDHLREAWRRYKADGDGIAGAGGWSHGLLGDQGVYTVRSGEAETPKRLFR